MTDLNVDKLTPPPELVKQWLADFYGPETIPGLAPGEMALHLAAVAARWGADQQLKHCADWLDGYDAEGWTALQMCSDLRPKPPSEAEQALGELEKIVVLLMPVTGPAKIKRFSIIRAALERLQQLEQLND